MKIGRISGGLSNSVFKYENDQWTWVGNMTKAGDNHAVMPLDKTLIDQYCQD